ncbi:HK97 gp10 family phage protein [Streptococcus sp.]|uniref:HK97 gp10 family phage protein n=1 Tax=Streptococcus sp. TaxID=1306 RepID=UPI0026DA70BA|nr:HK97 gp10 family phage protein [Streptococcus sp.]MDO4659780.1 HK97 gp10 family phage protein [Streptococcus sp.]
MATIDPSELARAVQKELEDYVERSTETVKVVVKESTKEAVNELKQGSPKKRGKYARGWTSTATKETNLALTKTIHNRTPGLTHLLENGHAKRGGGRVEGIRHIAPVEEKMIQKFEEHLKEKL